MKKFFVLSVLFVSLLLSYNNTYSQHKVGGGFAYGTEIEKLAIQLGAIFDINAPIEIAPDFKYYFTDEFETFWELNANVHYNLTKDEKNNFFLLGGLNYATRSFEIFGISGSNSEIGLNIGAGADFNLGGFSLVPEVKYVET